MNSSYSRIKSMRSTKSKSMDLSSTYLSPLPLDLDKSPRSHESNHQMKKNPPDPVPEEDENNDEIKANNYSSGSPVSSVSGLKSVVNKALSMSMRRSSSVSERYCRIHDQSLTLGIDGAHADDEVDWARSVKHMSKNKKKSNGKFLQICKKLLRL